jgi:hypothetical protein
MLRPMTAAGEPRRLELEVRFDEKPIQGRLYEPEADVCLEWHFTGWLGLMSAIEAAGLADGPPPRSQEGKGR